jgi:UDP-N-acetylglucosamine 1-carboxyvinyltransferase
MGASINEERGMMKCTGQLSGKRIYMDRVSVGATENTMLAAVAARGTTVIENAACEPEIADLQIFLNAMGADIQGAGTKTIIIHGGKKLENAEHTVMPDRIVAGTYLTAAAVTGGMVTLTHTSPRDLVSVTANLAEMGCEIKETENTITLRAPSRLKNLPHIVTGPYPGFPTDMQSQFTAALATASGTSVVSETIFESRNRHIAELMRMRADITITPEGRNFIIIGRERLQGAVVEANDLRGGAALIIAGLAAEGETVVRNARYIQRGYENIADDLRGIGGDVELAEDTGKERTYRQASA